VKNNLRKLRQKQGMNQRQLAEVCHTPQSLVSDIERGTRDPWPAFINRVCAVLNVDKQDVFPGCKEKEKEVTAEIVEAPAVTDQPTTNGGESIHGS